MMFFFGPKVLLLLKRHSLEIYLKGSDNVMNVPFNSTALRHLEVVNRDEVIKTLVEAFKSSSLKKQIAVIALSDQVVFEKLIHNEDPASAKKSVLTFYHNIPLEEKHIATKIIPLKGSVLALGANRDLYKTIAEVAMEFDWKIKAIVPMTLFSKTDEQVQLTQDQVNQILSAEHIFKEADFLNETTLVEETTAKTEDSDAEVEKNPEDGSEKKSNPILTALIALFSLCLILGSLFYFKIISLPFRLPWIGEGASTATPTTPEASSSAQIGPTVSTASGSVQEASASAQVNKEDVRIHVLNGSGISGQAAKFKDKLTELGYVNVITGNIESEEVSTSSATYANNLDGSIKDEINELIDSLIEGVTKSDEDINEFNAVITIGKLEEPIE